jgi:toxin YoeB
MFDVLWHQRAEHELDSVVQYWDKRNGSNQYSSKLIKQVTHSIDILRLFPKLGKTTNIPNVREYVLGDYSLFYTITNTDIGILSFWDNRQDRKNLSVFTGSQ